MQHIAVIWPVGGDAVDAPGSFWNLYWRRIAKRGRRFGVGLPANSLGLSRVLIFSAALVVFASCVSGPAAADSFSRAARPTLGFYGTPGLIDMPTAYSLPDGGITLQSSYFEGQWRGMFNFQLTSRLSGSFRYAILDDFDPGPRNRYDRSFDMSFRILDEGRYQPALAIGLRDFGGTGVYGAEYLVASKSFGSALTVTGGLGWGRLASRGGFENPLGLISDGFKDRSNSGGAPGELNAGRWFTGDAAPFGGVEYRPSDRLSLKLEYSSDAYTQETSRTGFKVRSPFNASATYRFENGLDLTAAVLQGSTVGVSLAYTFDPRRPKIAGGVELAGPTVTPRGMSAALDWGDAVGTGAATLQGAARDALETQGIALVGVEPGSSGVRVYIHNARFRDQPQAIGRAARALTGLLPAGVEEIEVVLVSAEGLTLSSTTLQRSDLEELEFALDGAWQSYARADIADAPPLRPGDAAVLDGAFPKLDFGIGAYLSPSYFDPDDPVRADLGVSVTAAARLAPGLVLSTQLRQPILGNLADVTRVSNSVLPHVRSDAGLYDQASDLEIRHLTLDYFTRPGPNLYGRVTAGYLERMYGGLSAELLWKPVDSRLALGAELNYVRQRDYDVLFGFQPYDVITGHASAYYDFGNGFLGQVDAGRYLAGDWGATFSVDREFDNGFKLGAFFTLTDVPFDTFGEGSFDKGIRFEIPLSWFTGRPSRDTVGQTIRPIQRDGGARLEVGNRLYGIVRDAHAGEMQEDWGRFWR